LGGDEQGDRGGKDCGITREAGPGDGLLDELAEARKGDEVGRVDAEEGADGQ
jgi:hypothetical protein